MNESRPGGGILPLLSVLFVFACVAFVAAEAQGPGQFPDRMNSLSDCGCSRGDDAIPVSSDILTPFLPKIPNLELGFLYSFGKNVRTGRFTADYLLPFRLNSDSVLFGEAHAEGWDFWKRPTVSVTDSAGSTTTTSPAGNRIDLSFGGGYRTMLGANTLLGVNAFYDASRLFNTWHSSGGVGMEFATGTAADGAIDLNVNWYGNLFSRDAVVNAFRNKGNSFDVEAGYSHSLFNQAMDLRLKLIGYQFDVGENVYGWRGGADITTRDGVFTLRYEYGRDWLNGDYQTVGGFVNMGFQLENLLSGESPFSLPEPVFRSPRNLRRLLGLKAKRNWAQPSAVLLTASRSDLCTLSGSAARVTTLLPHVTFTTDPLIPAFDDNYMKVRICWCGLKTIPTNQVEIRFYDGSGGLVRQIPHVVTDFPTARGCQTVISQMRYDFENTWNHVLWWRHDYQDTLFDPGGGISFEFIHR